jgi:hypothetical protein
VGKLSVLHLAFEDRRDMLLTDHVIEERGTPFAIKRLIHKKLSLHSVLE